MHKSGALAVLKVVDIIFSLYFPTDECAFMVTSRLVTIRRKGNTTPWPVVMDMMFRTRGANWIMQTGVSLQLLDSVHNGHQLGTGMKINGVKVRVRVKEYFIFNIHQFQFQHFNFNTSTFSKISNYQ